MRIASEGKSSPLGAARRFRFSNLPAIALIDMICGVNYDGMVSTTSPKKRIGAGWYAIPILGMSLAVAWHIEAWCSGYHNYLTLISMLRTCFMLMLWFLLLPGNLMAAITGCIKRDYRYVTIALVAASLLCSSWVIPTYRFARNKRIADALEDKTAFFLEVRKHLTSRIGEDFTGDGYPHLQTLMGSGGYMSDSTDPANGITFCFDHDVDFRASYNGAARQWELLDMRRIGNVLASISDSVVSPPQPNSPATTQSIR